jgi:threonine dehydrogenase-like Zn-dependent dehydrogenase
VRAVVLEAPGALTLVQRPEEEPPGPAEALVAVRRVGICGTDYHAFHGEQNFVRYPCVLGHELAVEVLEVGRDVAGVAAGDLCAVLPYVSCGACPTCAAGRRNACERIEVLGVTRPGGLRERMVVPADLLFPGDGLTLDELVLVETLGVGWHAAERACPAPHHTALVVGAGPIGLATAQALTGRVDRVLVTDLSADRVAAAVRGGLDAVLVDDDPAAAVRERLGGVLPGLVLDASGSRSSMETSFGLVGPGGRLVLVGHTRGPLTFDNPVFHGRELEVRASRNATADDWGHVVDGVRAGRLRAVDWVNHRSTLETVATDLPALARAPGSVVKAVVDVGGAA